MNEIILYGNMTEKYRRGNQVFSPYGISICLPAAMGLGGGVYSVDDVRIRPMMIVKDISPDYSPHPVRVSASRGRGGIK